MAAILIQNGRHFTFFNVRNIHFSTYLGYFSTVFSNLGVKMFGVESPLELCYFQIEWQQF
jgi:hypothetical protein